MTQLKDKRKAPATGRAIKAPALRGAKDSDSKSSKTFTARGAKSPVKKAKRPYNNSSRAETSEQTQKLIIETLVELLVERRGGEVRFDEISEKSKISERTIFRFFKDKQALHQATDEYLRSFLQSSIGQLEESDFLGFMTNAYKLFDKHENLTMAYLFSPFGNQARDIFRKKLNQLLMAKILKEQPHELTSTKKIRLALIVSLVNAKLWYDLKTDFGYSGAEIGEVLGWALKLLLKNWTQDESST